MDHPVWTLLDQVQDVLEKQSLWQTIPPSPDKMMSVQPFSIDTLSFLEWLQWIYIARLRALLESGAELPKGAQVFPYAEEALKAQGDNLSDLLALIAELDDQLK